MTATFSDQQAAPCNVTATVTVNVSGTNVTAYWTQSSNNDDCTYLGTFNANCTMITGLYTCDTLDAGSGNWTVTIQ
jgi:hypothetical protein